jgi:hypothetical protein
MEEIILVFQLKLLVLKLTRMKTANFDRHMRLGGRWGRPAGRLIVRPLSLLAAVNICVKPLHDGINPEVYSDA